MDPQDHLRSRYQAFQALAYHLKLKNPLLKKNVKFCDVDQSLEMDFNVGDGTWRSIGITEARDDLRLAKSRKSNTTKKDLADRLWASRHADILDSSSGEDDTMVEVFDAQHYPLSRLSVITANARSLVHKLESLFDCVSERQVDFGCVTETWIKEGKQLQDLTDELKHAYSLGIISRSRQPNANNARAYGGVAIIYRLSRATFKRFEVANPDDYEVLAAVGKVQGVKSKVLCIACYAPQNMGSLRVGGVIVYLSDIIAEAKQNLGDVLIVVSGDYN